MADIDEELEDDELSPEEEGFLRGYEEDADETTRGSDKSDLIDENIEEEPQ
jgi:hypothetical protein